jgi:hypothetical protein
MVSPQSSYAESLSARFLTIFNTFASRFCINPFFIPRRRRMSRAGPFFFGISVGVAAGGAGVYLYLQRDGATPRGRLRDTPQETLDHPALKYGAPATGETTRAYAGFVSCFDTRECCCIRHA